MLTSLSLSILACRPSTGSTEPEPAPPAYELPSLEPEPDLTPLDLSRGPLPDGVVAAVDGEPIFEVELERITHVAPSTADPVEVRAIALLGLVERRLLQAEADHMDVRASEDELQTALGGVASANGLSMAELEAEVVAAGWTWDEYRREVIGQIVEMKVLDIHGVLGPGGRDPAARDASRSRLLGCMRARAEIQVRDPELALPDNPFERVAEISGFRFTGAVTRPEAELAEVARAAAQTRVRLCDALTSAELAVQELYLEHGYLEADVEIPWPTAIGTPIDVEVRVTAGRPHRVGAIAFDQSAVPEASRVREAELRTRVAAVMTRGQSATMSTLQAAGAEVGEVFRRAGLGSVEVSVERKESADEVRLDITYRVVADTS